MKTTLIVSRDCSPLPELRDDENVFHDENFGGYVAQYRVMGEWVMQGSYMTRHDAIMALIAERD